MGAEWPENQNEKQSIFPDGFEAIPFGTRIDAVGRFLAGLLNRHAYDPTDRPRGAEAVLDAQMTLWDVDLSGMRPEDDGTL